MADCIEIYTDGSSRGNPGPGGYGIFLKFGDHTKQLSQGYRLTTNNRMELLAIIVALEALHTNKMPVIIYSDSKYVVDSIEKKWMDKWIKTDFAGGKKNKDLWTKYFKLSQQFKIKLVWVKGHSDNPFNNLCDKIAVQAAQNQKDWKIDYGYESGVNLFQ